MVARQRGKEMMAKEVEVHLWQMYVRKQVCESRRYVKQM